MYKKDGHVYVWGVCMGGMTPQNTPRYATGLYLYLWGSLGYPKYVRKMPPHSFDRFLLDIIKKFYPPLLFSYKKVLHLFFKCATM